MTKTPTHTEALEPAVDNAGLGCTATGAVPDKGHEVATVRRARLIALYLPQYHPIPENDQWWGKGFTEWTNVAKARPLFRGHYQPRLPADLGFYDLRVPETRAAQAELASKHGIEAFCYYHYWFGNGQRLLERPFNEVLRSGEPNFPFSLCWANESWNGIWFGAANRILKEQTYPGMHDHEAHFNYLLEAFSDPRYLTVDGKPLFCIYRPLNLPDCRRVTDYFRDRARKAGLKGLHLVAFTEARDWKPGPFGFDAVTIVNLHVIRYMRLENWRYKLRRKLRTNPLLGPIINRLSRQPVHVYPYGEAMRYFTIPEQLSYEYYPCVIPNWDNAARCGLNGYALHASTPELFAQELRHACDRVQGLPEDHRIVIVKSWNEWAEGNYLEPDQNFGLEYLEAVRREISIPAT